MKRTLSGIALLFVCLVGRSQDTTDGIGYIDTFQYERFLETVEYSLFQHYKEVWGKERAYEVIDSMGYEETDRPKFSDSTYLARLESLNKKTIINIDEEAGDVMLPVLKYFAKNRRKFTGLALGRSKLFFPMYEEYLDKYDIPIELKYLSVIESGLRPLAKSRVGASGLWQFMYRTGRMYDLHSDSYVDERLNPRKATDAACRYLKYLHGMYGDWAIALAAYNAGPGNVNKAIRRSGGQMNYWKMRPFLPKETQMYVPNFIAMLYMMTYNAEHNITPIDPKVYNHEVDTVCIDDMARISVIDSIIGMTEDDFRYLNPTYKTDLIPDTEEPQCLTLPVDKIPLFLEKQKEILEFEKHLDSSKMSYVILEKKKNHYVKPGESMAMVAEKYDVMVSDIKKWNGLRYTKVYPNQKLTIMIKEKKFVARTEAKTIKTTGGSKPSTNNTKVSYTYDGKYKYYTLKQDESLWTVSQKLGIPFGQIQELNKDLDPKRMQPGDKIRIKKL